MKINGYDLGELESLAEPTYEEVHALFYVKKIGALKAPFVYNDPRTNKSRQVNEGQAMFAMTSYNYGSSAIWYFPLARVPTSILTWTNDLKSLSDGQDCSIYVTGRNKQAVWEPNEVDTLVFGKHEYVIPSKSSGFVLMESFDRVGTISFANNSMIQGSRSFVRNLVPRCFDTNFDREHPKFKWFVPQGLPELPI